MAFDYSPPEIGDTIRVSSYYDPEINIVGVVKEVVIRDLITITFRISVVSEWKEGTIHTYLAKNNSYEILPAYFNNDYYMYQVVDYDYFLVHLGKCF